MSFSLSSRISATRRTSAVVNSVRSTAGIRSKAMRSTTWIRNTSTSRMNAKYWGPISMSNWAERICLSMFWATRQTMNASALAVCCGVFGAPGLNQWLLMRKAIKSGAGPPRAEQPAPWPRRQASSGPSIPALAKRLRQPGDLAGLLGRPHGEQVVQRLAVGARPDFRHALEQIAEVRRVPVFAVLVTKIVDDCPVRVAQLDAFGRRDDAHDLVTVVGLAQVALVVGLAFDAADGVGHVVTPCVAGVRCRLPLPSGEARKFRSPASDAARCRCPARGANRPRTSRAASG